MTISPRSLNLKSGKTLTFSLLGFGAAPLGNMHVRLEEHTARATVEAAWATGMRYFDTAPLYGHGLSERRLGAVLRAKPRNDFVISTKVGRLLEPCRPNEVNAGIYVGTPNLRARFDYSYDGVMRSIEDSLVRLGLDHVDILYVHDIDVATHGSRRAASQRTRELLDKGGWRALQELRAAGKVMAIGAGVNECEACEQLLAEADPDIFLLAGRCTLLDQSALDRLLPSCASRGVGVVIGGPYNSGILATGPVPGARYDYAPASPTIMERARLIEALCMRHGVPLASAALHFPLLNDGVVSVIPGSRTVQEVAQNTQCFSSLPPAALWHDLAKAGLIRGWREMM